MGLLNLYNLISNLASHQLVSQNCRGQLFCYFWPDLSHFKPDFDGIREKIGRLNLYNITSNVASHLLVSHDCSGQLFCYFWPYLTHFKSDFDGIKEKIRLLNQYNLQANPAQFLCYLTQLVQSNQQSSQPPASLPELLWLAILLLWPYRSHFKSDLME